MKQVSLSNIHYEKSDTVEMQGPRSAIQPLLNAGYYPQEDRNGYWVMVKPAKLLADATTEDGTREVSIKEEVLDYYDRKRISTNLINRFRDDVKNDQLSFVEDEYGRIRITK